MTQSYPNSRDCEHGSMRGKCDYCDHAQEVASLEKRIAELDGTVRQFEEHFISHWVKFDPQDVDKSMRDLLDFVATMARDPSVSEEANAFALEQQAKGVIDITLKVQKNKGSSSYSESRILAYAHSLMKRAKGGDN